MDGDQQRYRILIQILVGCIEQARQNRHFQFLDTSQQNVILQVVWFECFLLRAACWTIDVLPIVASCKDSRLTGTIEKIQGLQLDLTELCLMETMILFRKEHGTTRAAVEQLESINEGTLLSLGRYILHKGHPWPRYGRLLLTIRSLSDHVLDTSIIYLVFKGIIAELLSK